MYTTDHSDPAELVGGWDEDTIELRLSPEEILSLSRAAEQARAGELAAAQPPNELPDSQPSAGRPQSSEPPASEPSIECKPPIPLEEPPRKEANVCSSNPGLRSQRSSLRIVRSLAMAAAVATLALAGSEYRSASPLPPPSKASLHRERQPAPIVQVNPSTSMPVGTAEPANATQPEQPQGEPVRVRNPFDASEVFQFPAGTSMAEARQSVAAVLLGRARERASVAPRAQSAREVHGQLLSHSQKTPHWHRAGHAHSKGVRPVARSGRGYQGRKRHPAADSAI
jgi:hypothetical protein